MVNYILLIDFQKSFKFFGKFYKMYKLYYVTLRIPVVLIQLFMPAHLSTFDIL